MDSRYFFTGVRGDAGDNIKFELSTDNELERLYLYSYNRYLPVIYPTPRRIAGSKRVERYQLEHGHSKGSEKGRLLQSITAHPTLSTRSFEVCVNFFTSVDRLLLV